ncbi:MAG: hypothetical protein ABSB25_06130 [Sedimentisphaerales bacterium]|jgi:hypothetical protein
MLRQPNFLLIFLFSILSAGAAFGDTNLALHKSYTLYPKPNYPLCTDDLDVIQLTDGEVYDSYWEKKSTVGWQHSSTVTIVIDLLGITRIDQVTVNSTGGGSAGVEFPEFIAVFLSKDGKQYSFGGMVDGRQLSVGENTEPKRIAHVFVIDNLDAEGRFVKVIVRPKGHLFFCDEIKVIQKEKGTETKWAPRKTLVQFKNDEELLNAVEDYRQLKENIAEVNNVLNNYKKKFSDEFFNNIFSKLEKLAAKLKSNEICSPETFSLLRMEEGAIRAEIYQEIYKKPFVCIAANPMQILYEKDFLFPTDSRQEHVDIQLWQGEHESAAVNVVNCSQEPLNIAVSVSPLMNSNGVSIDSNKTFTLRKAVYINVMGHGSIADPLVLQGEKPFQLQPGRTVQIWLDVFNPQLNAGDYTSALAVNAQSVRLQTIPIYIKVAPIVFPREVALNSCTWAYPEILEITKDIMQEAARDFEEHYNNVFVVHPGNLPHGKKVGQTFRTSDFSKLDKILDINRQARIYLILGMDSIRDDFGEPMSPSWKTNFSQWLIQLVQHLKDKGIGYERFAFYPYDEKLGDEFYQLAELVKKTDPNVKIYANSAGKDYLDFERFVKLIDIWCFDENDSLKYPDRIKLLKSFGKEVWTYNADSAPAKAADPLGFYRLMPWRAFKRGQTGIGFWVYSYVTKGRYMGWDDTMNPELCYDVVYGAAGSPVDTLGEKIIPSRRWQAWREGIEDYQYLYELQNKINTIKNTNPTKATEMQQTLDKQVDRVLNNTTNPTIVYEARGIITSLLK